MCGCLDVCVCALACLCVFAQPVRLQALGEAPLKTALTGLVGHGIKPDAIKLQVVPIMPSATPVLLQRNAGEIKIIFTFACASDLAAQIGSTLTQITDAGLSSAITDVFVKMGIDPAPRISVSYLAATWFAGTTATTTFVSVASSTTRISSACPSAFMQWNASKCQKKGGRKQAGGQDFSAKQHKR